MPDIKQKDLRSHLMMKCIIICLFLLINSSRVYASENNKTLHEWYNHYYLHQDNRQLIRAINYFYSSNVPASELKEMSRQGFFSALFKQQPQQALQSLTRSQLSADERRPLLLALSSAGLSKQALQWAKQDNWSNDDILDLTRPVMSLQPIRLLIRQDHELGFLWGAFKASGNTQYLDVILNTLLQESSSTNPQPNLPIITTAIQTLHYHRANDSRVDDYYLARFSRLSTNKQAQLDILFSYHEEQDDSLDCD